MGKGSSCSTLGFSLWVDNELLGSESPVQCRRPGCSVRLSLPQVFIRELISNGSDALEKLRHRLMAEGKALPEMEIHLQTDGGKGTITIQVPPFSNRRMFLPAALTTGLTPVKEWWELSGNAAPWIPKAA